MKSWLAAMVGSLMLLSLTAAGAKTFTHPCGFTFELPARWSVDDSAPALITAKAAHGAATIHFEVPEKGQPLGVVLNGLDKELARHVADLTTQPPIKTTINELTVVLVDGVGHVHGENVAVTVAVYTDGARFLVAFAIVPQTHLAAEKAAVMGILRSVKGI